MDRANQRRMENKHSEFILFMNKNAATTQMSDDNLKKKVMSYYGQLVRQNENEILQSAKNNRDAFSSLDFRSKDVSKDLLLFVEGHFEEFYAPKIVEWLKKLYSSRKDARERSIIMQEIIGIFEKHSPLSVIGEIIKIESNDASKSPEQTLTDTKKNNFSVKKALTGSAISIGIASKQRTLAGGAIVLGGGLFNSYGGAKTISGTTSKLFSKIRSSVLPKAAGTKPDFTPKEEDLEKERTQGRTNDLLEKIEENTRNSGSKEGKPNSGLLDIISKGLGSVLSLIPTILSKLGILTPILTALAAVAAALGLKDVADKLRGTGKGANKTPGGVKGVATQAAKQAGKLAAGRVAAKVGSALIGGPVGAVIGGGLLAYEVYDYFSEKDDVVPAGNSGTLTRHLESKGNYGAINPDDKGRPSYGAYQFRQGSGLSSFFRTVAKNEKYVPLKALFKLKQGSKEFNTKWKKLASDPETAALMQEAQDETWQEHYYKPAVKAAKKRGFKTDAKFNEVIASAWTVAPSATRGALWEVEKKYGDKLKTMSSDEQSKAIIYHLQKNTNIDMSRLNKTLDYIFNSSGPSVKPEEIKGKPESKAPATNVKPVPKSQAPASIVPEKTSSISPNTGNTVIAPSNTTNVNQTMFKDVADARNRMNPIQEYQFSRLVAV